MFSTHNRFMFLFGLLLCCSANAAMYSCVDESGTKVLRNYPCEKSEKQQVIENEVEPSHTIINSTGERQSYRSREPEKYIYTVQKQNAAGNDSVKDEVCEKRRKEIDESTYHPTTLAGALVMQRNKQAYERDCIFRSSSDSGGGGLPEKKRPNAFFTGRMEQMLTGEWNCEYSYNGQNIWKVFRRACPSNTEVE